MSPEVKSRVRGVAGPIAAGGGIVGVFALLGSYGVLDAVAVAIRGNPAEPVAIEQAVAIADQHARELITSEIAPVRAELRELTRQVDRMAGALEESNRRRQP